MADRMHLLHVKSSQTEEKQLYGLTVEVPKRPKGTDLLEGEIAVNFAEGHELLSIKNSNGNIVGFLNENNLYEAEEIITDGLATEKLEREEALATEKVEREEALTDLDNKMATTSIFKIVSVTYGELKSLRDNSQLKPGQLYRITDFVTTTTQENTQSAAHPFDIIVLATDVNVLNENAKAIKHDGDTYFDGADLDAWEVKYSFDNDTTKFAWADTANGKGVIFYMKDEWNNECPYDFKNIMYKRWAVTDVQNSKLDSTTLDALKTIFVYDNDNSKFISRYAYKDSNCTYGDTTHVVNANDAAWYYTFSTFKYEEDIFTLNDIEDASIKGNNGYNAEGGGGCFGNSIKPYYDNMASAADGIDGAQYLNNIVFNGYYEPTESVHVFYHCFNNSIGYKSYDNTFGIECHDNSFGNSYYGNTFGDNCYYNSFGNNCYSNTFGNMCSDNMFGNNCYSNTFGNMCSDNMFGNECYSNTFGGNCTQNMFGNNCYSNTFGNGYYRNTFGNSCQNNKFGNSCDSNKCGDNSWYNTFGDTCYNNTFENGCGGNNFGNNCHYNSFENGCTNNTFETQCEHNSFGNSCGGNSFGTDCKYNSFGNICNNNKFGNNCLGNTFGNYCGNNTFVYGCSSNKFGNNDVRNTFGNICDNNTFENYCQDNTFGNECHGNTFGNHCNNNTFKNNCRFNSVGNGCIYISFTKDYMYSNIVENNNNFMDVTSTETTSSSTLLRNITISQGVNTDGSRQERKTISHNTTNDTFKTTYYSSTKSVDGATPTAW